MLALSSPAHEPVTQAVGLQNEKLFKRENIGMKEPPKLFEYQLDQLSKEIDYVQNQIHSMDNLSFQIKGWALTLWTGIVAFGVNQDSWLLILASLPILLAFWILDAQFKKYQRRCTVRKTFLEHYIDSRGFFEGGGLKKAFTEQDFDDFPIHDPIASRSKRLGKVFQEHYNKHTNYRKAFFASTIRNFYGLLIVSSLVAAYALWLIN